MQLIGDNSLGYLDILIIILIIRVATYIYIYIFLFKCVDFVYFGYNRY